MSAVPTAVADKPSKAGRVLVGLALAAGLVAGAAHAQTTVPPGDQAPPNMRAIIAADLQRPDPDPMVPAAYNGAVPGEMTIFPAKKQVTDVEVLDATRRTLTMLHGWTWQTCLRAKVGGQPMTLAVFVDRNRVIDARSAVLTDRCDEGSYAPLPVKRPQPRPSIKAARGKKAAAKQSATESAKPKP